MIACFYDFDQAARLVAKIGKQRRVTLLPHETKNDGQARLQFGARRQRKACHSAASRGFFRARGEPFFGPGFVE
jgi:hypothetical protein